MDLKEILKITGVLLVPLMLGIATTMLSIQQTRLSQKNRENEMEIARQERLQDVYLATQSENERILASYMHDISIILLEKNGSFDTSSVAWSIIRAKTLTALLQLDVGRKRQVVLFLYETKLIDKSTNHPTLDLFDAVLDNLDMSLPRLRQSSYAVYNAIKIKLRGVSLINSSFRSRDLYQSEFSRADLTGSDLTWTRLTHVDFRYSTLNGVDFMNAAVDQAVFAYANLTESNLSDEQLLTTLTLQGATLPNGTIASLKNLLINGDAEHTRSCGKTIVPYGWTMQHGSIVATIRPDENSVTSNKCYFSALSSHNVSSMYQEVDLRDYGRLIAQKAARSTFNVTFSGIEKGQTDVVAIVRYLSDNGTVLDKVTICCKYGFHVPLSCSLRNSSISARATHDEHCDAMSLLYQSPFKHVNKDLFFNGRIDTRSVRVEIIFKKRTMNASSVSKKNVTVACDNIVFSINLTP